MNILVISQYFYPETFRVNTLCEELVQRGHTVTVLTGYPQYPQGRIYDGYGFRKPYEKEWNGVHIERVRMRPRGRTPIGLLLNCLTFVTEGNRWVRRCKTRYDAVYVFEVSPVTVGLPAVTYKKKFGSPLFFNVQDLWPENVEVVLGIRTPLVIAPINRIVDKIYAASDRILCSSNGFVENIAKRGVPESKLVFWPQFCNTPAINTMLKPSVFNDSCFHIVFAGNIGDAQGLDLLLEAAIALRGENIRWFLVGDGRAKARLQKKAEEQSLTDTVLFPGRVSEEEANRYIYFADCAYLSFQDNALFDMTIPAKLQSYLACGTPILAAAGGESAKIIQENHCGLVTAQTATELCKTIQSFLALSTEEQQNMRTNALQAHQTLFKKDMLLDSLEEMFSELQ